MSAPGTKMISAVFAFVRAAVSISRSTTCGRNAGSCDARYGACGPAFSASRSIALFAGNRPRRYGIRSLGITPRTRPASVTAPLGRSSASSIASLGALARPITSRSDRVCASSPDTTSPP